LADECLQIELLLCFKNRENDVSLRRMEHSREKHKSTFGQKAADKVASWVGSWKYIIVQSVVLIIWMILNVVSIIEHWDPYPFIFLNLVVAFVAVYTAPIILMSQNRSEERDRKKFEIDLATDRKSEKEIEEIKTQLNRIEHDKIKKILEILEKK